MDLNKLDLDNSLQILRDLRAHLKRREELMVGMKKNCCVNKDCRNDHRNEKEANLDSLCVGKHIALILRIFFFSKKYISIIQICLCILYYER